MQRNILQDYANTVCEIFSGWRLQVSPGDFPLLMETGRGRVTLDLLTGETTLDDVPIRLSMSDELAAWLRERADKDEVPWDSLRRAVLSVVFDFQQSEEDSQRTRIRRLNFDCSASIETEDKTYHGSLNKVEVGTKSGDGPWIVY